MEKRAKPRFGPLVLKAQVEIDGARHDAYLTNISIGGAFLAVDDPPSIASEVAIRTVLPWNLGELRARARVRWRNDSSESTSPELRIVGAGVEFIDLDEPSRRALESYLQRFAELAARIDDSPPAHEGH